MNSENTNNQELDLSKWVFAIEGNNLFACDQEDQEFTYWADGYSDYDAYEESATTQTIFKYRPDLKGWVLYGLGGTCVYKWEFDEDGKKFHHEWGHGPVYAEGNEVDFLWVDRTIWTFKNPNVKDYNDKDPKYVDLVSIEEAAQKFPKAFPLQFPKNPKAERAMQFWTNFFGFYPSY